jgi:hypothetical protein
MHYIVKCLREMNLEPVIRLYDDEIIHHIMGELQYVIPTTPSSIRSHTNTNSSEGSQNAGNPQMRNEQATGFAGSGVSGGGRSGGQGPGKDDEKEYGAGGGDGGGKRPRLVHKPNSMLSKRYACPFYKRNSAKYQNFPGCPGPGWVSVHRLK